MSPHLSSGIKVPFLQAITNLVNSHVVTDRFIFGFLSLWGGGGEGEEAFVAFFLVGEKSGDLYTKQIY